jgi:hypothetical protein
MDIFIYNDNFLYVESYLDNFIEQSLKYNFISFYVNKFSDLQYYSKLYYLRDIFDKYIEPTFKKYKFPLIFKDFLDKLNLLDGNISFYGPTYNQYHQKIYHSRFFLHFYQKIYIFKENNSFYKKYPFLLKIYVFFLRQIEDLTILQIINIPLKKLVY